MHRMTQGYLGFGLVGIKDKGGIPECEGIYGAQSSHWHVDTIEDGVARDDYGWHNESTAQVEETKGHIMPTAPAGIDIYRPLLPFCKKQLMQTCMENDVPWVEDKTNQDTTLTARNTIRSLLKSDLLPESLRARRLLQLKQVSRDAIELFDDNVASLISATSITHFDMRTGTLGICLPMRQLRRLKKEEPPLFGRLLPAYLETFIRVVSPHQDVDIKWSHVLGQQLLDDTVTQRFNMGGLLCTPSGVADQYDLRTLTLQRESPRRGHPLSECIWPPSTGVENDSKNSHQLWDGRFWIEVRSESATPVICRHLTRSDLNDLQAADQRSWRKLLSQLLHGHNCSLVLETLPVLLDHSSGELLALPTLGLNAVGMSKYSMSYKTEYKNLPHGFWDLLAKSRPPVRNL